MGREASDDTSEAHISACLALLREPTGKQVVPVGSIPSVVFDAGWFDRVTNESVIIKERRNHYLEQHPDLIPDIHEPLLIRAILRPNEVHRNVIDPAIAIIYQSIPGISTHFLRVALWISGDPALKNSVHSARLARRKEVLDGRDAGRQVWP